METTMDTLVINVQSSTENATKSIGKLISSLKKLQNELDNTINKSAGLTSLKNIKVGAGVSNRVNQNKGTNTSVANTMSKDEQLSRLGINLDNFKLVSAMSSLNNETLKYKNNLGQVVTITNKAKNGVDNYNVSLRSTSKNTKNASDKTKLFGKDLNNISLKVAGLVASLGLTARQAGGLIKQAAGETEALNLFVVSLGENAKQGIEWVERFSSALYLDPVSVMQYMGSFNSLVEGLGVGAENSYIMSQNLTQLVYDLSSFKNIPIESAYEKLMSGVSGELEPLRNVGVAMTEATLQTLAYELGIEKLVRNMTEAEKTQLRYIQIMRSSTKWQTDMGRTLIYPANAMRILQQQFTLAGRAIGKLFIPILMEAMPYLIAFTQIVSELATKLAHLLGYEIPDIDYSNLGGISAGIQDIGNSAEDTAKKLNTMLAPFDDLNVVQKQTEKAGSGLGAFGGDLGIDLPTYDALANLNTKFAEGVEKAKKTLQDIIPIVTAIGLGLATWKITKSIVDFITWWDSLTSGGKTVAKIGLSIGLAFLGYQFIKAGNEDVMNEETLLKGVGEQLFGSGLFGVVAGMLTKNINIGMFIGFAILGFTGSETASHGDWKNGLLGFLQQSASIAGIAGLAFKLSGGNIELTLGIAALVTWANVLFNLAELLDMKPTFDEFVHGVNELPWAKVISDGILTPIFIDAPKKIEEFVIGLGTNVGNWIGDYILTPLFIDIPSSINKFLTDLATDIGNCVGDIIWGIIDGARELKDGINNKLQEMRNEFPTTWSSLWSTLSNKFNESKNGFLNGFDNLKANISNKLQELKSMFSNWKATLKTPHLEWKQNGIQATGTIKKILETLNLPTSLPKLNVAWYEQGGFPTSGDLFFANENGVPEMIGRIGNQTAVANNDQIATSLTNALISALNQYDFGGGQSPTTIYIGNRKVYEGYGEHVANENDRYGTNMIKI